MKTLKATVERNENAFFAYIESIEGCVAGGINYTEVKANLIEILDEFRQEDVKLDNILSNGYKIEFKVNLASVFKLLPEINISQLAALGDLNPGLLRQYVSGAKKASEIQTEKVMNAIDKLISKLNSISLTS